MRLSWHSDQCTVSPVFSPYSYVVSPSSHLSVPHEGVGTAFLYCFFLVLIVPPLLPSFFSSFHLPFPTFVLSQLKELVIESDSGIALFYTHQPSEPLII